MNDAPRKERFGKTAVTGHAARFACALFLTSIVIGLLTVGCGGEAPEKRRGTGNSFTADSRQQLFDVAVDNLNRLHEFHGPTMLRQIVDRLNDWAQDQPEIEFELPGYFDQLPSNIRRLSEIQALGANRYDSRFDESHLQNAVWFRDISREVCANQSNDLDRARALFDWTIRNIQLEPTAAGLRVCDTDTLELELPKDLCRPVGLTLFTGRGNAIDRAWVFAHLARQQRLEVVMLYHADQNVVNRWRFWLPALFRPDDGELFLFDTFLGLPLPGDTPDTVLTLRQLRKNPASMERLDIDNREYRVRPDRLAKVAAFVDTSPGYLPPRMERIEALVSGERAIVLFHDPMVHIERLSEVEEISAVYPWQMPFRAIFYATSEANRAQLSKEARRLTADLLPESLRPVANSLAQGRTLYFAGVYTGDESATSYFQLARFSDAQINALPVSEEQKLILTEIKQDASYWLGLTQYARGAYDTSVDYFLKRTIEAFPGGVWEDGARYNLARAYEETGDDQKAIVVYRGGDSPQKHGDLLRAQRIESQLGQTQTSTND